MNTEFIWRRHWAGRISGIDACVAKVNGIFPTPDRQPPEKKDQSVPGKRNFQSASKLSKVLHNRIRELTLGLRLYGLGAFSTQRLRRLWTWIRTFDTLVSLDTYIWHTCEHGYKHMIHTGAIKILPNSSPPHTHAPPWTTKYPEIHVSTSINISPTCQG